MKRVTVYLKEELHKALKHQAAETSLSVSDLVNDAVRTSLADFRDSFPDTHPDEKEPAFAPGTTKQTGAEAQKDAPSLGFDSLYEQMKAEGRIFD